MDGQRYKSVGGYSEKSNKNDVWSKRGFICREIKGGQDDQPGGAQGRQRSDEILTWKILNGKRPGAGKPLVSEIY